jgi:hypothetical protein
MSTRNLPGDKGRPTRRANNLTIIYELSKKCGSLDVSQPYGLPEPVTGIALPFNLNILRNNVRARTKLKAFANVWEFHDIVIKFCER